MLLFITIFSVILLISLLLAGFLYVLDRRLSPSEKNRALVNPSIFEFFTTLYAIFLGFALFTLWSAYINTDRNIAKEADALFNAYRSSMLLTESQDFRQALRNYVTLVIEEEWHQMANGTMSRDADKKFDRVLEQLQRQYPGNDRDREVYLHIFDPPGGSQFSPAIPRAFPERQFVSAHLGDHHLRVLYHPLRLIFPPCSPNRGTLYF